MPQDQTLTVTLHIGRHKTGTSSIQATLAGHRELLAAQGILYPACMRPNHSGFFINAFAPDPESHPNNRPAGKTRQEWRTLGERKAAQLRKEVRAARPDKLILLAEDACFLPPEGIRSIRTTLDALLAPARYEIVLYTRDPLSRALSGIQQNVKGNGLTLEDAKAFHLRGGGKRYAAIIEDYAAVFGSEALTVRAFEAALADTGDIVTDFCAATGIDPEGITPVRQNDSIAAEIVCFLSWLYVGLHRSEGRPQPHRDTRAALFALKGAKGNFLAAEDIDTLWSAVEDDMAFLEAHYGIAYRKPAAGPAPDNPLFAPDFMARLEAVLPSLSPALQGEMKRFLQTQDI